MTIEFNLTTLDVLSLVMTIELNLTTLDIIALYTIVHVLYNFFLIIRSNLSMVHYSNQVHPIQSS